MFLNLKCTQIEQTRRAHRKQIKQFDLEGMNKSNFSTCIKGHPDAQVETHRIPLQFRIRERTNEISITL